MPQSHRNLSIPSFDELKALAEKDPEQLEVLRHQLSMEFIESVPEEHQGPLLAQQSHIERIIERGNNPNHVNILLGRELGKQFVRFADSLNKPINEHQAADVIQFPNATSRPSNNTKH
ncbi:DUF3135 domain-containing protein [Aliivibrio fischeri]|uniref:DUF3135 domain-containing protein n=1 Tax=Aliivibrio fischeri TaxID=668 RepID=UPI0012D987DB|nr:DUF3135 domain-containing protein [Aliivibrio fischeri]MUK67992.1 DUF3135 domain-containing protein [Aliivibrio fischeri]MUK72939.1 DUF3135 domain-containing protein [Aliivibrio fischeri]MUK77020.1 DUF3135 domain-containing protein [Aliivibrio fischeri]